jgi:hypothetical protein
VALRGSSPSRRTRTRASTTSHASPLARVNAAAHPSRSARWPGVVVVVVVIGRCRVNTASMECSAVTMSSCCREAWRWDGFVTIRNNREGLRTIIKLSAMAAAPAGRAPRAVVDVKSTDSPGQHWRQAGRSAADRAIGRQDDQHGGMGGASWRVLRCNPSQNATQKFRAGNAPRDAGVLSRFGLGSRANGYLPFCEMDSKG